MEALHEYLSGMSALALGVSASLAASLGTGVGALPAFAFRTVSQRAQDVLLSIAAGIMLAATAFSLVAPGLVAAERQSGSATLGALIVCASLCSGALAILLIHRYSPHEHFIMGREGPATRKLRRAWLFVIAITLHNFPEGMAVGVGFGGGDLQGGLALTAAIFMQNLPEGFVVALALIAQGSTRLFGVAVAFGTGLVETLGGLAGATAVSLAEPALPWALGFAAGAMLFVISHEIVPETHRNDYATEATLGTIGGFCLMLLLNAVLG